MGGGGGKTSPAPGSLYLLSPGATELCNKPGPLQFDFLLPSDVAPNAVDVTDANDAILLRLML